MGEDKLNQVGVRTGLLKVGEILAVARECKGWTLRELERESGVSNALISQIETGKIKDPGFSTVVRLCEALGVKIERASEAVSLQSLKRVLLLRKSGADNG